MSMTKKVYLHCGDLLDIRLVPEQFTRDAAGYKEQLYPQNVLIRVHGADEVAFANPMVRQVSWDGSNAARSDEITALRARLEAVEKRAESARWNVDEDGNLVRLCRGDHDKDENCSDHEELFVPLDRAERAEAALATARWDAANIARSFSCCHVPDEIAALIEHIDAAAIRALANEAETTGGNDE